MNDLETMALIFFTLSTAGLVWALASQRRGRKR